VLFIDISLPAWLASPSSRVVNIGSGIGTDSIADSDTQYRISIGGTFKKRVPEGYRGGIDRYSDTDTFFSPLKPISSQQQIFSPADDEISRFFQSKTTNDLRCLDSSFPYIRKLFIQLNTGLPSSAAVERLFSLGGRVLTPMRTQLSDQRFESLVFLRSNASLFKI
jgi:hypothetical protein